MKYLIIDLNFLVKNPQPPPPPGKYHPPSCESGPPKKLKSTSPTLFKNASKILGPPAEKGGGGGHYGKLQKSHKKSILKNFVIFTGKHCWGLFFIKVTGLQASNCIKKGLNTYFLVNIGKLIRTPILKNICKQLLLHF